MQQFHPFCRYWPQCLSANALQKGGNTEIEYRRRVRKKGCGRGRKKLQEETIQGEIETQVKKRLQEEADRKLQEEATQREIETQVETKLKGAAKRQFQEKTMDKFHAEAEDGESKLLRRLSILCAIVGSVLCGLVCLYALSQIWNAKFGFNGDKLICIILFIALLIFSFFFFHISKTISIAAKERSLEYRKQINFLVLSEMINESAKKDELYQIAALSLLDSDDAL